MRLIETQGRGQEALVEIAGQRLVVLDGLSPVEEPLAPGALEAGRLQVIAIEGLTQRVAPGEAASQGFLREHGIRYRATGRIVSREPLALDFGKLRLDIPLAPRSDWQPGDTLSVAIDQIRLVARENAK